MTATRTIILSSIKLAGYLSLAVIAPNTLAAFDATGRRSKERVLGAIQRLKDKGYVQIRAGKAYLTPLGEDYLKRAAVRLKTPRRWDGKWRIVIFDIPEKKRRSRDMLRSKLVEIGFLRLQNSTWIFPYDCEDLVALMKTEFHFGREVLYMIVDSLENAFGSILPSHNKLTIVSLLWEGDQWLWTADGA